MKEVETVEKKEVGKRPNNLGNWLKTGGKGRVPGFYPHINPIPTRLKVNL